MEAGLGTLDSSASKIARSMTRSRCRNDAASTSSPTARCAARTSSRRDRRDFRRQANSRIHRVWRRPHEKNQKAEQTDIQVQYAVVDRIHRKRRSPTRNYVAAVGDEPLKVTLPSPLMMTLRLVAGVFARRVSRSVRAVSRRRRHHAPGGARAGRARMRIHPARCAGTRDALRSGAPRVRTSPIAGWIRSGC